MCILGKCVSGMSLLDYFTLWFMTFLFSIHCDTGPYPGNMMQIWKSISTEYRELSGMVKWMWSECVSAEQFTVCVYYITCFITSYANWHIFWTSASGVKEHVNTHYFALLDSVFHVILQSNGILQTNATAPEFLYRQIENDIITSVDKVTTSAFWLLCNNIKGTQVCIF